FLKILHPDSGATDEEFEEYVAYATECRRRVKEQMNKRKPDDEFARINLSYFGASGERSSFLVLSPKTRLPPSNQSVGVSTRMRRRARPSQGQRGPIRLNPSHRPLLPSRPPMKLGSRPLPQSRRSSISQFCTTTP